MLADDFFSILEEKLAEIESEYGTADEKRKQELAQELGELRRISDFVIQMWFVFEEKMSKVAQIISGSDQSANSPFIDNAYLRAQEDNMIAMLSGESSRHFRQGQGYFDLHLYEQSVPYFRKVVEKDPDCSVARLYLALGYFLAGQKEDAHAQLKFLLHTENYPVIQAIAHNTFGCLLAEEGRWEKALHHFSQAADILPNFAEAVFNSGMLLVKLGNHRDAVPVLEKYIARNRDDWEAVLLLAEAYRVVGKSLLADQTLQKVFALSRQPDVLRQLAVHYEQAGQHHNAAICYAAVIQTHPDKAWAWHGLGWNLWLHEGAENCFLYIKKAVSLEPGQLDYWFSYGWILQRLGYEQKADEVFSKLLRAKPDHAMTLSAMIVRCCGTGKLEQAEKLCRKLMESADDKVRGLGYHHLGRIAVLQEDYNGALSFFTRSIQMTGSLVNENYLYRGICNFYLGNRRQAEEDWQKVINRYS